MKKAKISKLVAVGLCICALTGCGLDPDVRTDTSQLTINSNTNENNTNGTFENGTNDLLGSADMSGSVFEFTDSGCSVSQKKEIEGGAGVMMETDGKENKDNAVSVKYNSDCEFVIATLNAQSGTVTNVTSGSISDVKKQSDIYFYGEFVDTFNFSATKVVIAHWE